MSELIERLRDLIPFLESHHCSTDVVNEAIEALSVRDGEVEELRAALSDAVDMVTEAVLDNTYSVSRLKELKALARIESQSREG